MLLSELLRHYVTLESQHDCVVHGLALDSRLVKPGDCFLAFPGEVADGRDFIAQAIAQGAVAIIAEPGKVLSDLTVPIIFLDNVADFCSDIAAEFYGHPARSLSVIGVTGTNGKTSCAYFLAACLTQLGYRCGLMGTLGCGIYGEPLHMTGLTTADPISVQKWLAQFRDAGAQYVAMEVSSHALAQQRVAAIAFNAAIFTNLSHDHLDYHHDMEHYFQAKRLLFTQLNTSIAVINADDIYGQRLLEDDAISARKYSYSVQQMADIQAIKPHYTLKGITANLTTTWGKYDLFAPCLGRFYLSNVLAIIGVLGALDINLDSILNCIKQLPSVPGRMQTIRAEGWPLTIIDYAHTPDALEKVLKSLKTESQSRLWCIFGCGGNRDKTKRPIMGHIAETEADYVVVTDDNPRHEKSEDIINDILVGIKEPQKIVVKPHRAQAIAYALHQAKPDDIILIAGKGHENYQIIGDNVTFFSDEKTVDDIIKGDI